MNRKIFFDEYRQNLDKDRKITETELKDISLFLDFYESVQNQFSIPQWAYIFATTFHETAHTFAPVIEAYWLSEDWRKKNFRYYPFYGRGYVQITWRRNYEVFSKILGEDFVKNPDLVRIPKYAFMILIKGFKDGIFTGKKISDYINSTRIDYKAARRCINGTDKSALIESYAKTFEVILNKSNQP